MECSGFEPVTVGETACVRPYYATLQKVCESVSSHTNVVSEREHHGKHDTISIQETYELSMS